MNTAAASSLIRQMVKASDGRLVVGAGTVLTMGDLYSALDAGATFIVLPVLVPDVVEYCAKNSIPVFPGALTPQEISNAWRAGATMVQVFPAGLFGPKYFTCLNMFNFNMIFTESWMRQNNITLAVQVIPFRLTTNSPIRD